MRTAQQAAEQFKDRTTNRVGMCLWHVQDAFGSPHLYPSAIEQWKRARKRHKGDRTPRYGAPVFYEGGKHGHVAIYVGNGRVRSTDAGGAGKMATVPLDWFAQHWGYTYLGWTEDIGGAMINFVSYKDVYVARLRPGVDNSDSVRMLRLALIRRGFLAVQSPLSEDRPGNKYTKAVSRAVKRWQTKHDYSPTGVLNNKQATKFFAPNKRVRLRLARNAN